MVAIKGMDEPIHAEDDLEDTVNQAVDEILKINRFNIRNMVGMDQNVKTWVGRIPADEEVGI